MTRAALLLALVACGSHTHSSGSPAEPASETGPTAPANPPKPPACPASFATARGTCGAIQSCGYPEGTCSCGPTGPVSCPGGAMVRADEERPPSRSPPPPPMGWRCVPKVRADGCPGTEPAGACTTEGQRCRYGECCITEYTCKDSEWDITMQACPP